MKKLSLLAIIASLFVMFGGLSALMAETDVDKVKVTKSSNPDGFSPAKTGIPETGKSITEGLKESQIDSSKLLLTKEGGDAAPVKVSASDSTNPDLVSAEPVIGSDKTHLSVKEEMDSKKQKYVLEKHSAGVFVMKKIGGYGGAPHISDGGSI